MAWTNFLNESKKYMGYGKYIPKRKFWLKFPRAAIRFYYYQTVHWLKIKRSKHVHRTETTNR